MADDLEYSAANCVRCGQALLFMGTRDFHEGTRWGVLGELAELFVNRERFELFGCRNCGHVEFFVEGVGDDFRRPIQH